MSEMNPAIVAGTRIAVDLLTMWTEHNQVSAVNHVDAVLNDPNGPGAPIIVVGQLNVGAALVVMLAQAYGAVTADEIMVMAGEILRGLARDAAAM